MIDKVNTKHEAGWIRCGKCGHKLARIAGAGMCDPSPILEFKCHSCKTINEWSYTPEQGYEIENP